MSDRTEVASAIATVLDNTTGSNTPAIVRAVFTAIKDRVYFQDELGVSPYSMNYTRIADDNTAPSSAQMSFNTGQTKLYINKENSYGDDCSLLFNIMGNGKISGVNTSGDGYEFVISTYSLSGNVYTLNGSMVVSSAGAATGVHVLTFDVSQANDNSITPAARFEYARIADNSTPSGQEFSLNSAKTQLKINEYWIDDINGIFDLMRLGTITIVDKLNSLAILSLRVTGYAYSSTVYTFTTEVLVNTLGANLGDYVLNFYPVAEDRRSMTFDFVRVADGSAPSTTGIDKEFSFDAGKTLLNLASDWGTYDNTPIYDDMGKNGGIVLLKGFNTDNVLGIYRVVGNVAAPAPGYDVQLNIESIFDESTYSDSRTTLTFIPNPVSITNRQLTGTQLKLSFETSVTVTPSAYKVSFGATDVDAAGDMYINVGSSLNLAIWSDLENGSRILIRCEDLNDGYVASYAVCKVASAVTVSGTTLSFTITDSLGQTNISDFTAITAKFIIEFYTS